MPLSVDGRFDDEMYRELAPFSELIQQEPGEWVPANEPPEHAGRRPS